MLSTKFGLLTAEKIDDDDGEWNLKDLLAEREGLKVVLDEKETCIELLQQKLQTAKQTVSSMQLHNQQLQEADDLNEMERLTEQEIVKKKMTDLELELKRWKQKMEMCVAEKKKMEEIVDDVRKLAKEQTDVIGKLKGDLRESTLKELKLEKACDDVERDNVQLQQQVNSLMKSLQHCDIVDLQNKKLLSKNQQLSYELKQAEEQKGNMESTLKSTIEMLNEERSMRLSYKRELDALQVIGMNGGGGSFLNQSILYSSIYQSIHQDCSFDNMTILLDGLHDDDEEEEEDFGEGEPEQMESEADGNINVDDLNSSKMMRSMKDDLLSELMRSCDDYLVNMNALQSENEMLRSAIGDLQLQIFPKTMNKDDDNDVREVTTSTTSTATQTTTSSFSDSCTQTTVSTNIKKLNVANLLRRLQRELLEVLKAARSTYMTICNCASERANSKALLRVEECLKEMSSGVVECHRELCGGGGGGRFRGEDVDEDGDEDAGEDGGEEWKRKLLISCLDVVGSTNDLLSYSVRVVDRTADAKFNGQTQQHHQLQQHQQQQHRHQQHQQQHHHQQHQQQQHLHDQVLGMQTLLAAKTEQLVILRQMISSNKSMYEESLTKLTRHHDEEMKMKKMMMTKLKDELDEVMMKNAAMTSSENIINRKCEAVQDEVHDLNERLSSSELERRTLNSLLRLAIQHKLVLLNKLKQHGIPINLYDCPDNHQPGQSEGANSSTSSIYQPIKSFHHHPMQASADIGNTVLIIMLIFRWGTNKVITHRSSGFTPANRLRSDSNLSF
ncbi:hypothetical protein HELRODRAFT_194327 [Helobdella robusta]|uniref:Uncharacterized protein n=1 Tax=Helobdella robusta TaxID=6412 RepID=T1FVX9_HELRO|nr:hypothetical protein HELRODRAFT_194327 [Helobdella robusta]ESN92174.1 hypothetical protein HELRODRAFT_194327 [Helobdella robusta]